MTTDTNMSFGFDLNDGFAGLTIDTPADGCTQCGICLSVCPTFRQSSDVEQSPMGRIRMMRALESGETDLAVEKLESCLGCYACAAACPSRVDYAEMLDQALVRVREQRPPPAITRWMLSLSLRPRLLTLMVRLAALAQCFGVRRLLRSLGLFKALGLARADRLLGRLAFPKASLQNRATGHRSVALFRGCFSSVLEQQLQQTAIGVLNALSIRVVIPEGQGCCGALHRHSGDSEQAIQLARNNVHAFSDIEADAIISTSSGCGAGLQDYAQWLGVDAEGLTLPVMDISHYLAEQLKQRKVVFRPLPLKVALHTPCSLKHTEGQEGAVSELLGQIPALELIPLSGAPACCGAGGSQMLSQGKMADALRDEIIHEVMEQQPDILLSSNLGCAMHLRAGLEQAGLSIPLKHPVELIAQAMLIEFVSANS